MEAGDGTHYMARQLTSCRRALVQVLQRLHVNFKYLDGQIAKVENGLTRQLAQDDLDQRLTTMSGIALIAAKVLASKTGEEK